MPSPSIDPRRGRVGAAWLVGGATFVVGASLLGALPPDLRGAGLLTAAALAVAAGALAARDARRRERKAERWEKGLCLGCGYDLRHSTGRCPECGREFRVRTGSGRMTQRPRDG